MKKDYPEFFTNHHLSACDEVKLESQEIFLSLLLVSLFSSLLKTLKPQAQLSGILSCTLNSFANSHKVNIIIIPLISYFCYYIRYSSLTYTNS